MAGDLFGGVSRLQPRCSELWVVTDGVDHTVSSTMHQAQPRGPEEDGLAQPVLMLQGPCLSVLRGWGLHGRPINMTHAGPVLTGPQMKDYV